MMTKAQIIGLLKGGKEVVISRERCAIDDVTVSRKVIDALRDAGQLTPCEKVNNFMRKYKFVQGN